MKLKRLACALLLLLLCPVLLAPLARAGDLAVERKVFEYLTGTMGLNHAAACGVLANIEAESDFRLGALGDGGTSYGLCQWHNSRFDSLRSFCVSQGLDYTTLDGQLAYLNVELRTRYPSTYAVLRQVPNSPEGAYTAAFYWCVHFEAPANAEASGARRGMNAQMKFWNRYASTAVVDSHGYSGLNTSLGLGNPTFYWESDEPEPTLPTHFAPTPPVVTPVEPDPVEPTEPAQETKPESGSKQPQEAPQEPVKHVQIRYLTHHSPDFLRPRLARMHSPLTLFFLAAGPVQPFRLREPEEEAEDVEAAV